MRRNVVWVDLFREIWHSKNRFFSILAIVALGTGFFAGIKATTPNMKTTANEYYQAQQLSDFHLLSTMGLTNDDIQTIQNLEEVRSVMPGYSADLLVGGGDDMEMIMKVISLPINTLPSEKHYLNQPVLKQGKMPYQSGECLLDANVYSFSIGDTISFVSDGKETDLSDKLYVSSCRVVGLIDSPRYVSFDRGSSAIGNGVIRGFIMLPERDFSYEVYTDLYVSLNGTSILSAFSDEYTTLVDEFTEKLERIADRQEQLRYDDIYQEAMDEITKGELEFLDGKAEAEHELRDAWTKLVDGRNKLEKAKIELAEEVDKAKVEMADARLELEDGEATYEKEYADFLIKIADAQKQIDEGWVELEKGENKLANGKAQLADGKQAFEKEKAAAIVQLEQAKGQVEQLLLFQSMVEGSDLASVGAFAAGMSGSSDPNIQALGGLALSYVANPDETNQSILLGATSAFISGAQSQIDAGYQQLNEGQSQLNNASSELSRGQRELNQARLDLQAAQQELLEEQAKALSQFQDARIELEDGYQKLEEAEITLAEEVAKAQVDIAKAENDLNSGLRDYTKAKREVEEELLDAEVEIADAKKELAKLELPKWYVLDRTAQPGYASYEEDAQRVDKIAGVFPLFFILIAALVCLTTMSRMVEEQRVQIGTWKALGYSQFSIVSKYLLYALMASVLGCAIGLTIGFKLFPTIIFNAYRIMYIMPDVHTPFHINMTMYSLIVSILCTTLAAGLACRHELTIAPSQLMRPKPPKSGKRVLLEQIPWIWDRFSFHAKITIRNLMRYKGRVLMTMIGIGGCTALMLTGFGLQYSISSIVDKQFGEVFHYDVLGAMDDNTTSSEKAEIDTLIQESSYVLDSMMVYQKSVDVASEHGTYTANLFIPEEAKRIASFISFKHRIDQEKMELSDDGVILSEKLAKLLEVSVGDEIVINEQNQKVSVTVEHITENYTLHYVYMTPDLYKSLLGVAMQPNMVIANLTEETPEVETAFAVELLDHESILGVAFSRESGQSFGNMIGALSIIVLVIIVCAGALAFVVLYNLTNINVNERLRELATIKVLGFYDIEVSSYIYRENTISSALGMLTGLVLGIFLHRFVIANAEVEMVMFTPSIDGPSFFYAGLLTMLFTLIVNVALHFRLKKIDMVESLKSVE